MRLNADFTKAGRDPARGLRLGRLARQRRRSHDARPDRRGGGARHDDRALRPEQRLRRPYPWRGRGIPRARRRLLGRGGRLPGRHLCAQSDRHLAPSAYRARRRDDPREAAPVRYTDTEQMVVDTHAALRRRRAERMEVHAASFRADRNGGVATLVPGPPRCLPDPSAGGQEVFVLEGVWEDEHGRYPAGTWVRNPPDFAQAGRSPEGCLLYVKTGHLAQADRDRVRR
jgi:hypothetical protein